jgi:hypothetical protein
VKEATMAHLKRRHHFQVGIDLGHTVGNALKYSSAKGCLGIQDHNSGDYCTVGTDDLSGTFSMRRVR